MTWGSDRPLACASQPGDPQLVIRRKLFVVSVVVYSAIGSAAVQAFSLPLRTAEEATATLQVLPEVRYDPHDARSLYHVDDDGGGERPDRFDACAGLYTPNGDARRVQIFDVSDFGALGSGASRRYGVFPTRPTPAVDCGDLPRSRLPNGAEACRLPRPVETGVAPWSERVDEGDFPAPLQRGVPRWGSFPSRDAPAPHSPEAKPDSHILRLAELVNPAATARDGKTSNSRDPAKVGFAASDEWDWIGIQAAILAAHRAGGGTVVIPDTGADYLVNRGIWLLSNVNLVWLTEPSRAHHSYVRLTAPTRSVGSVIGPYNPYLKPPTTAKRDATAKDAKATLEDHRIRRSGSFVCRVTLIEPRVRAMTGENAVSFGMGSFGIAIVGGHLTGARFGTAADTAKGFNPQGGKGLQFESGVQQVVVEGTRITDSTIGVSSSAGYFLKSRLTDPSRYERFTNASDRIFVRNVVLDRIEMPFFFAGVSDPKSTIAPQSVVVEGFSVRNSGRLRTIPKNPYPGEDPTFQSGIVNLLGASNIVLRRSPRGPANLVDNDVEIGAFVRGYGTDIHIADVQIDSAVRSLVDIHTPLGRLASKPRLKNFSLVSTTVDPAPRTVLSVVEPVVDPRRPPGVENIDIDVIQMSRRDPGRRTMPGTPFSPTEAEPHRFVVRID